MSKESSNMNSESFETTLGIITPRLREIIHHVQSSVFPEELRNFAESSISHVRLMVAKNPNTPEDALGNLANDKIYEIRLAVAKNPNTPESAFENLDKDAGYKIQEAIMNNRNAPSEIIALLLSRLEKQEIGGSWGTTPVWVDDSCKDYEMPVYHPGSLAYTVRTLNKAKSILEIHNANMKIIMQRLKELNPELYSLLVKSEAQS